MQKRVIVAAVIRNSNNQILLGKKPKDKGVFAGKWGIPGGGIEEHETLEEALRREVVEETGLQITKIRPLFFSDYKVIKKFRDKPSAKIYMIALRFECEAVGEEFQSNDEFDELKWVNQKDLINYKLDPATTWLFQRMNIL